MESILLHSLTAWRPLGYLIIFLLMFFEGEMLIFVAAFLTSQGFFDPLDMLGVIIAGAIVGDALWYALGRKISPSSGTPVSRFFDRFGGPLDAHLRRRPFHTIFISKFVYGFNHPTLVRAGATGVRPKVFFASDVPAIALWVAIIGGLGYFSSASLTLLKREIRFVEIALAAAIVAFLVVSHFIGKRVRKELKEER